MVRDRHPLLRGLSFALLAVVAVPLLFLIPRALGLGWNEAARVATDDATSSAIWGTVLLSVASAAVCVALALPLAWLTHATDMPGRRWFRVLLILPLAVPSYVGGFVVILLFAPGGWLPVFDVYSTTGVVIALLFTYPLAMLTIQSALDRLDPRLWESARALGCSPWRAFWRIVFPQLRPGMATGGLLVALYAASDFGAVSLLRFESLSYLIYVRYRSLFDRNEAVFLALLLIAVATVLVVGFIIAGGRTHRQLASHRRAWPTVPLGRWRWPAFALCTSVVAAGVILPVCVVSFWLFRGLDLGQSLPLPTSEAVNTLLLGAGAAIVIVALAFLPTVLGRFSSKRGGNRTLRVVTNLGYTLPGIVVALALVSLATSWVNPLYQTIWLLMIAYMIRFFPLAVHALDDALAAQNTAPYWAARSLGCSPHRAWWRVVIPNTRAALAVALLAVFIAVIKELPATLILAPLDFATLATRIWSLTEDAYFAAAAPSVLLLLAFAVAALLLRPDIRRRRRM